MWYPRKVLHIRDNLFAGTESPSLSVYEPMALRVLFGKASPFGEELS
jgi:hypothetical protein